MERVDLKIDQIGGGISIVSCFQITCNVVEATTKVNYYSVIDSRIYCKVMIQRGAQKYWGTKSSRWCQKGYNGGLKNQRGRQLTT